MKKKIILKILYFSVVFIFFLILAEISLGVLSVYVYSYKNINRPLFIRQGSFKNSLEQTINELYGDIQRVYLKHPYIWAYNLKDYKCSGENNCNEKFRMPDGLKYSALDKYPVILFGCSFAHGNSLKQKQTFSFKLSEILKRPVYNRALQGMGIVQMYYQSLNDDFYKEVPPSDTVIFLMINDHYRRMLSYKLEPVDTHLMMTFRAENGSLYMDDFSNPYINLLKMTYTASFLNAFYVKHFIRNPKNAGRLTDTAALYFIKTREELEKHWNIKISNFIVIFYGGSDIFYSDLLKTKLENSGFKVILTGDLTDEDLTAEKYGISKTDRHPSEAVWDLLTPLIVKEAGL